MTDLRLQFGVKEASWLSKTPCPLSEVLVKMDMNDESAVRTALDELSKRGYGERL